MGKSAVIIALTLLFTEISFPAFAQNIPVCYMESMDGEIVSLEGLCGGSTQKSIESLGAADQQFLEDYKRSLSALNNSPEAEASLSSIDPQSLIKKANEVCNALNAGTFIEFRRNQIKEIAGESHPQSQKIANLQARTIQTIAPRSYCPGFDG
jgi:hypothetical protein